MLNVELIDRLIAHYSTPGTAPRWTWKHCLAGTLMWWGLLPRECDILPVVSHTRLSELFGTVISVEEVDELTLGTSFEYQARNDDHNRELILGWLRALREGKPLPNLHTEAYRKAREHLPRYIKSSASI